MAINQYKDGKGVNDHKKGNRTDSKRNTTAITEGAKQYSEDVKLYKEIAEKMRQGKRFRQEEAFNIYNRIEAYKQQQDSNGLPYTVSGMIKSAGVSKDTWYRMLGGEYDYKLYELIDRYNIDIYSIQENNDGLPVAEIEINGRNEEVLLLPYGDIIQKAVLSIEEKTEERLYLKGRVGDIFALKALHDWKEEQSPHTVNQTLVLASPEQAREAINLLK